MQTLTITRQQLAQIVQSWNLLKIFEHKNGKGQSLEIAKALENLEIALNFTPEDIAAAEKMLNDQQPKKDG